MYTALFSSPRKLISDKEIIKIRGEVEEEVYACAALRKRHDIYEITHLLYSLSGNDDRQNRLNQAAIQIAKEEDWCAHPERYAVALYNKKS